MHVNDVGSIVIACTACRVSGSHYIARHVIGRHLIKKRGLADIARHVDSRDEVKDAYR